MLPDWIKKLSEVTNMESGNECLSPGHNPVYILKLTYVYLHIK